MNWTPKGIKLTFTHASSTPALCDITAWTLGLHSKSSPNRRLCISTSSMGESTETRPLGGHSPKTLQTYTEGPYVQREQGWLLKLSTPVLLPVKKPLRSAYLSYLRLVLTTCSVLYGLYTPGQNSVTKTFCPYSG